MEEIAVIKRIILDLGIKFTQLEVKEICFLSTELDVGQIPKVL